MSTVIKKRIIVPVPVALHVALEKRAKEAGVPLGHFAALLLSSAVHAPQSDGAPHTTAAAGTKAQSGD